MSDTVLEQSDSLQTPRTTVRRLPARGAYDRDTIDAILDEAYICHVGFIVPHENGGQPFVIPTIHARVGDTLYFHGSAASRMLRSLRDGVDACVTVTLLDGLVLARSAFHHSMNYRSVVVLGKGREVVDRAETLRHRPSAQRVGDPPDHGHRHAAGRGFGESADRAADRRRAGLRARCLGGRDSDPTGEGRADSGCGTGSLTRPRAG